MEVNYDRVEAYLHELHSVVRHPEQMPWQRAAGRGMGNWYVTDLSDGSKLHVGPIAHSQMKEHQGKEGHFFFISQNGKVVTSCAGDHLSEKIAKPIVEVLRSGKIIFDGYWIGGD